MVRFQDSVHLKNLLELVAGHMAPAGTRRQRGDLAVCPWHALVRDCMRNLRVALLMQVQASSWLLPVVAILHKAS